MSSLNVLGRPHYQLVVFLNMECAWPCLRGVQASPTCHGICLSMERLLESLHRTEADRCLRKNTINSCKVTCCDRSASKRFHRPRRVADDSFDDRNIHTRRVGTTNSLNEVVEFQLPAILDVLVL